MVKFRLAPVVLASVLSAATLQAAEESGEVLSITGNGIDRLPATVLNVESPTARVSGTPGSLKITDRSCSTQLSGDVRRRIVDVAVQEWAWFGFLVDDLRDSGPEDGASSFSRRRFMSFDPAEVNKVAPAVGGYWAAAPGSDWILQRQNDSWNGERGLASRWRDPWSAAFISWVMCESGLGNPEQFQRAIAHHTYIDQAIRARDTGDTKAAYAAYDPGEAEVLPGDLLCSGLRHVYRNLDQRRAQLGVGARTHCDVVVATDMQDGNIMTIGGNVRSSVRMKVFPAAAGQGGFLAPLPTSRIIFAHLKLKAGPIEYDALQHSAVLAAGACRIPKLPEPVASLTAGDEFRPTC